MVRNLQVKAAKQTRAATTRRKKAAATATDNATSPTKKATKKTRKNQLSSDTKENRCITEYFPIVSRRRLALAKAEEDYNKRILDSIEHKHDPTENLLITEFEGKGKGVVATTKIQKGDFVCEYAGDLINLDEALDRENSYERSGAGCYMYYFEWNRSKWCLDATLPSGRYGRLINHSRKAPNCKTKIFPYKGVPHLIFIALRDIAQDEEILYDYGERDPITMKLNPWLKST